MRRWLMVGPLVLALGGGIRGQRPEGSKASDAKSLAFEVASVKLHTTSGINERSGIEESQSSIRVENLPLKALIETAYGMKDYQFTGPSWLDTVRYDVVAKPPVSFTKPPIGFTQSQLQPLLRALLADRFKLVVHHESKEMSGYELRVAKSG